MLNFAVLTISDRASAGTRPDLSGPALTQKLTDAGHKVITTLIVPDNIRMIQEILVEWSDSHDYDVILTTGGTGFAPRDVTPEATLGVIERSTPGIVEAIRVESLKITPHAMLSRAVAGIRGNTIIINFPGSPKAAVENLQIVLPVLDHAVALIKEKPESEIGHDAFKNKSKL
jgi:molybdopterin adenylyltransferase